MVRNRKLSGSAGSSFRCTRNALLALNFIYILLALLLLVLSLYGRLEGVISNLHLLDGVTTCGLILFVIALLGLIGAAKHSQIILFFYMIMLFMLFVIQFSTACASLAVTPRQRVDIAAERWQSVGAEYQKRAEEILNCCGFNPPFANMTQQEKFYQCGHLTSDVTAAATEVAMCCPSEATCSCGGCAPIIDEALKSALQIAGFVGLFFSFTEFVGIWLTVRYRNLKNPRGDPNLFI